MPRVKVSYHRKPRPILHFLVHIFARRFWLKSERISSEIDNIHFVGRLRKMKTRPKFLEWIVSIETRSVLWG
jgi:hypothetical protein